MYSIFGLYSSVMFYEHPYANNSCYSHKYVYILHYPHHSSPFLCFGVSLSSPNVSLDLSPRSSWKKTEGRLSGTPSIGDLGYARNQEPLGNEAPRVGSKKRYLDTCEGNTKSTNPVAQDWFGQGCPECVKYIICSEIPTAMLCGTFLSLMTSLNSLKFGTYTQTAWDQPA